MTHLERGIPRRRLPSEGERITGECRWRWQLGNSGGNGGGGGDGKREEYDSPGERNSGMTAPFRMRACSWGRSVVVVVVVVTGVVEEV